MPALSFPLPLTFTTIFPPRLHLFSFLRPVAPMPHRHSHIPDSDTLTAPPTSHFLFCLLSDATAVGFLQSMFNFCEQTADSRSNIRRIASFISAFFTHVLVMEARRNLATDTPIWQYRHRIRGRCWIGYSISTKDSLPVYIVSYNI